MPVIPCGAGQDPLALTTAVQTLALSIAAGLGDEELALAGALFTQLGDTLATIAAQRAWAAAGCRQEGQSGKENP